MCTRPPVCLNWAQSRAPYYFVASIGVKLCYCILISRGRKLAPWTHNSPLCYVQYSPLYVATGVTFHLHKLNSCCLNKLCILCFEIMHHPMRRSIRSPDKGYSLRILGVLTCLHFSIASMLVSGSEALYEATSSPVHPPTPRAYSRFTFY